MLKSDRVHLALALVTAVTMGCGGGETKTGTGGTGGQAGETTGWTGGGSGGTGGVAGSGGSGGAGAMPVTCDKAENTVLGVSLLSFGEGDSGQWKTLGFDIDGLETTALSKDVCQPNAGADKSMPYPDGDKGIDNSFGHN